MPCIKLKSLCAVQTAGLTTESKENNPKQTSITNSINPTFNRINITQFLRHEKINPFSVFC
uniref:Uncharacterized protein n=1 Tax=Anguilla anguilla TaxID=7936 RepID=A0A0E9XG73_ANGAN